MKRSIIIAMLLASFVMWCSSLSAQPKNEPTLTLNQQKTDLTLTFPNAASTTLDAAEVDKMMLTLAQMRADMKPPRPLVDPVPGTTINIATAGRWFVQPDGAGVDLAILHPGYGWVGLQLTPSSMEQLNRRLSRSVHRPPIRARHSSEHR
jgi:hypothetical protein